MLRVGDCVRVGVSKPYFKWGSVDPGAIGRITRIGKKEANGEVLAMVDFKQQKGWKSYLRELVFYNPPVQMYFPVKARFDPAREVGIAMGPQGDGGDETWTVEYPNRSVIMSRGKLTGALELGDRVMLSRICSGASSRYPDHPEGTLLWGTVVTPAEDDIDCFVIFDRDRTLKYPSFICDLVRSFEAYQRVRVRASVRDPHFGWGGSYRGEPGVVLPEGVADEVITLVDLPGRSRWRWLSSQLEPHLANGDPVKRRGSQTDERWYVLDASPEISPYCLIHNYASQKTSETLLSHLVLDFRPEDRVRLIPNAKRFAQREYGMLAQVILEEVGTVQGTAGDDSIISVTFPSRPDTRIGVGYLRCAEEEEGVLVTRG